MTLMTPEEKRRRAVIRRITGKGREGDGKFYAIEEIAQRLEFEFEKQQVAYGKVVYGKKRRRLTQAQRAEWQQEIAGLGRTFDLLRRDPRLCAMDLRIPASPAALATLERDILSDPEALRALLEFEAELRGLGCPTALLLVTDPPAAHTLCAIGEHHSYSKALRGGCKALRRGCAM